MCDDIYVQKNVALDQVLAERRSHRRFTTEPCSREDIHRILHAGLLAPFSAATAGSSRNYFRRFFVLPGGSRSTREVLPLVLRQVAGRAADLEAAMAGDPALRARAARFAARLAMFRDQGIIPGIGNAPYYIIVAERKEYPPSGQLSLAHCLENMWLKATALGLGFHLVTVTAQMADDAAFCAILGLPTGEWDLAGCAIGHPADELSPAIRPPVEDVTRWLD